MINKKETIMKEYKMSTYWTESSENFSKSVLADLESEQKDVWQKLINDYRPAGAHLNVLDAGCGPGFFSILMAQQGHAVTAIDFSKGMLKQAWANAENYGVADQIAFLQMDAQHPAFDDNRFDLIVSRNITWIFKEPVTAYGEWLRILKPGGKFLVFDGNWYRHLFDEEVNKQYLENLERANQMGYSLNEHHEISETQEEVMMKSLPLSNIKRPEWDRKILKELGCEKVTLLYELPRKVMSEVYAVKNEHTPMFMVCAEKV